MEQNFQTSFIPKKPIVKERATSSRPVGVFLIASLFILATVLLATGGLYFYRISLKASLAQQTDNLNKHKSRFEPSKITELQVLDKRLRAANEILSNHIAIDPVFDILQKLTMKNVRYTKFSYDVGGTDTSTNLNTNQNVNIKLSGQATSYEVIALQADLFAKDELGKNLIDPVFSNLTLDNSGNVLFDLNFSVDPSFVNYKQKLLTESQS